MTRLLYLEDSQRMKENTTVKAIGQDERGAYVVMDQTIFYPQGGGQPSDVGFIEGAPARIGITMVRSFNGEVRHYVNDGRVIPFIQNERVILHVDPLRRALHTRYHTAAHLIADVIQVLEPSLKALKSHSFPGEAYVEFQGVSGIELGDLQTEIQRQIAKNLPVYTINKSGQEAESPLFRTVQFGDFPPTPCGGTHVTFLAEIGNIQLKAAKVKKGITKVRYEIQ